MSKPLQKMCKRGHLLEHNRFIIKTKHKKTGVESGCRLCKNMRLTYYNTNKILRENGLSHTIEPLNDYAEKYFSERYIG